MFKKILISALLSFNAMADTPSIYYPKTNEVYIPRLYIDKVTTGFLQNIHLQFDDNLVCTVKSFESVPSGSGLEGVDYSVTTSIYNFVGLAADSIFITESGMTFRVLSYELNSIEALEDNPTVIINKMKDGNFILSVFNIPLAVEPYVYRSRLVTSIDSFVGVRNKTTFTANGRLWQSESVIAFPAGSNVVIYDQKYMTIYGYTFRIKSLG